MLGFALSIVLAVILTIVSELRPVFVFFPLFWIGSSIFLIIVHMSRLSSYANKALSDPLLMNRLPKQIRDWDDLNELLKMFGESSWAVKSDFMKFIQLLQPRERLYFIKSTTIQTGKINAANLSKVRGKLFVSDRRFVFQKTDDKSIIEYDLRDIHSVGSHRSDITEIDIKTISFCTLEDRVDFEATHRGAIAGKIRDIFLHAIISTGNNVEYVGGSVATDTTGEVAKRMVECTVCTATVIVIDGQLNQCEYCGRHVM